MDLSEIIKKIRADKNITQSELARRLNLERGNYSRLESRGKKLTIEQLESIADALGTTLLDILTWGSDNTSKNSEAKDRDTEVLQMRVKELEEELKRSQSITDALVYALNLGKGLEKPEEKILLDNYEKNLGKVISESAKRLGIEYEEPE